jgi:hypothetical protein
VQSSSHAREKKLLDDLLEGKSILVEGGALIKRLYCTVAAMGYFLHVDDVDGKKHLLYITGKEETDLNNSYGIAQDLFD